LIHRVDYSIKIPANKSLTGKDITIPSNVGLQTIGALLNVSIMPGKAIRDKFEKSGQQYLSVAAQAMIDTGASGSVITPQIAGQLGLIQTGYTLVASVNNQQRQPEYYGSIGFSWGGIADTALTACPLVGCDCLIGRNILQYWYFTYDGKNGTVVICD